MNFLSHTRDNSKVLREVVGEDARDAGSVQVIQRCQLLGVERLVEDFLKSKICLVFLIFRRKVHIAEHFQ